MVTPNISEPIKRRRRKSVLRCAQCGSMFRLPLWSRESGQGPVCDACSNGDNVAEDTCALPQEPTVEKPTRSNRGRKRRAFQPDSMSVCANCQTTNTPLWRRDANGNAICNACGLYYKLHLVHRPITMMRTEIKRRKRSSDKNKRNKKQDEPEAATNGSSSSSSSSSPSPMSSPSPSPSSSPAMEPMLLPPLQQEYPVLSSPESIRLPSPTPPQYCGHSTQSLIEKRRALQQEVERLSSLLTETTDMIAEIDTTLATRPSPVEDVARSLLTLARLPPPTLSPPRLNDQPSSPEEYKPFPRLPPITAVGATPPPFEFSL
ncbi:hypothetical protein BJV82DRAFT_601656 [Fennellomyces sp. T-0311]|nr:hypothetical protein BJV82DRAFT_601656 [Fennellomyces sp. T-0311]